MCRVVRTDVGLSVMTILIFPSSLSASVRYAEEARQWGQRVVGASSIRPDPNASVFDAWSRLPFIGDPQFFAALRALTIDEGVTGIFTPHAPTFHLLQRDLAEHVPALRLLGPGPFRRVMDRIRHDNDAASREMEAISTFAGSGTELSIPFVAGLLAQAETIHGECAREKILAICGIMQAAPRGDIVEIGALFGKSSYVLNRAASRFDVGSTLCVDPWLLDASIQTDAPKYIQEASSGWDWETVYSGFLAAMLSCSAPPFNYLRLPSASACEVYARRDPIGSAEFGSTPLAGSIAVLHLDGNHDEAAVAEDFRLWSPYLAPGAWVIFDDYHWPHGDGPRNVADSVIRDRGRDIGRTFVAGGAMFIQLASAQRTAPLS